MEIGQLLKSARLEAGLSQRELCGDIITRNMLSQIENGNARPSMDTLTVLAARLGKPVSYFLSEPTVSPNQETVAAARTAFSAGEPYKALTALESYAGPDPVFDGERYLLEMLCCLSLAQGQEETAFFSRAAEAAGHTLYCVPELECRWLLLRGDEATARGEWQQALRYYSLAESTAPRQAWPRMENCYRQLEDYKQAYRYACLQRT